MTKRVFERSHHSLLFNCLGSMSFEMWYSKLYFEYCGLLSQLLLSQFWPNFNGRVLGLREAIKKKLWNFEHCPKRGGGSAPQPNFLSMKSMDICIEGRVGWSSSSKLVCCIKVCLVGPWTTVSQFHNGIHGSKQRNYRVTYQTTH